MLGCRDFRGKPAGGAKVRKVREGSVVKSTKAGRIRDKIAQDVLFGELQPGTRLGEKGQSDRYDGSRTPVREAFRHLAALGLLESRPRRGVYVPEGALDDLFEVLAGLEAMCADLAAHRITDAECARIRSRAADGTAHWLAAFHRSSHNKVIATLAETLWQMVRPPIGDGEEVGGLMDGEATDADLMRVALPAERERAAGEAMAAALEQRDSATAQRAARAYVAEIQAQAHRLVRLPGQ